MCKQKIKVLHFLSSSIFSGAENVVFQIINLFSNENFDMAYSSRDGQIREALEREGIQFYPLSRVNIQQVSRVVKKFRPDIIHAHDVRASVIASFFTEQAQVVSHMHVNHEKMGKVNLKTILYLTRANSFRHILWVSDSAFDNYIFKDRVISKSSILYNVVDIEKILTRCWIDTNCYDYDVVYLGRLCYQKNPKRLISVLNKAIKIEKNLRVAIIGTGDLANKVRGLVESNKIQDNISLLGYQSNPLKILKHAKVMLMTSRFEGTPMCALEAMALGVPIVSTPTDGLVDIIQDGVTGYLSENDDVLAERVTDIVADKNLYEQLSSNSRARAVSLMNTESYKNKINEIYTQCEVCRHV